MLLVINQTHTVSPVVTNEISLIAENLNRFEICPSLNTSKGQIPKGPHRIRKSQMTRMVSLTRQSLGCTERRRRPTPGCTAPGVRRSPLTSHPYSTRRPGEGLQPHCHLFLRSQEQLLRHRVQKPERNQPAARCPVHGDPSGDMGLSPCYGRDPAGDVQASAPELAVNAGAALGPQQAGHRR